ncbi:MAG: ImmA/IrrE family metallo-endopeptidase [Chloroflexi bacterium]|nr:ImmA/IrrE family metallo-endopeptidase [Chloroflexota bacterium]
MTDDPEEIALQQRRTWGTSWERQLGWHSPHDALWAWRDGVEERRIPVFQAEIPREEAQGFSLDDEYPYVIVLTTKDAPTAKCFTLFHEYAHLLLREGGICITQETPAQNGDSMVQTELWCHRFAEAFLVGSVALESRSETSLIIRQEPSYEIALRRLASSFKVSQQVILFRLWHMNLLPEGRFWQEFNRVKEEGRLAEQEAAQKKKSNGGPSPAIEAIHQRGRMFTRMVLDGLDREMIGNTDAISYLGIRLKHLEKLRAEASR